MWQNTLLDKVRPCSTYLLLPFILYSLLTTDTCPCGSNHCSCRFNNSPYFIQQRPVSRQTLSTRPTVVSRISQTTLLLSNNSTAVTKCLPAGLWLYPILQHLSNRSRVHIKLPRPQTVFLWGYQCCSAFAWRVKICTQQRSRPTDTFV